MSRILFAAALVLLSLGPVSPAGAQLGSAIRRRVTDALKDAPKTDTSKASKPDSSAKGSAAGTAAKVAATVSQGAGVAAAARRVDPKIWENFDFIPGSRVLFYTDFSEDRVGNFARSLKYVSGPLEIVERNGAKVLRATGPGQFLIPLARRLPQRFTLEIDAIAPVSGIMHRALSFEGGTRWVADEHSASLTWNLRSAWIEGGGRTMTTSAASIPEAMQADMVGNVVHLRVLMDSGYLKMYVNERRTHNVPELLFRRDSVIWMSLGGDEADGMAVYVTGIRVAESETDVMYDALMAAGRWMTQGLMFETGKADLRPESRAVLKMIGAALKQYNDLQILIEGHTDNVGVAAENLALSDQRAAAVKAALVSDFGISADRITTQGMGDTRPVASNATAIGRAQNRRVEIVKR